MSAEIDVYTALKNAVGVTAIVAGRIYPDVAQQNVLPPLIVFERTASEPVTTIHDGAPVASKVTVSVSGWATTRLLAEQIGDAAQLALHTVGISVNRFGHYDDQVAAYASVIEFEVWELPA